MLRILAPAAVCLLAWAVPHSAADDAPPTYSLAYRFEPGQILEYTVENGSTIHVQVGDVADTVRHTSESGKVYHIASVDADGSALIEPEIDYVRLTADHQGQHVDWDSRTGDEAPAEFRDIVQTIGRSLGSVRVSPAGEVTVISLRGPAQDAQLRDGHFDLFPRLPDGPIAVGDSWKETFEIEIMASPTLKKTVSLQRLLTLKSVEKGLASIDVRTVILSPIRDPLEEGQLIQRTPSGTLTFDIERGRLVRRELAIDKRCVGFQGPQTSLQVKGTRNESLAAEEKVAATNDEPQVQ